jgi:glycosyltransferase involved in cell wall biosynthesis
MARVLFVVSWSLFTAEGNADGPRIRFFEMARALQRKGHEVAIAQTNLTEPYERDGIRIMNIGKDNIDLLGGFDVIVTYPTEFLLTLTAVKGNTPLVIDLYDPVLVNELFLARSESDRVSSFMRVAHAFSKGDLFLCANENQRTYYAGLMNILGGSPDSILVLPFGISSDELVALKPKLKGLVVPKDKRVVLWPGEMYPWFDPFIALEAMRIVFKQYDDVVLVFVGSDHFLKGKDSEQAARLIAEARLHGLLDKKVFFVPWVPYAERAGIYLESEIALVTYHSGFETKLSCRTRIVDCLWGEIPVVCTKGDMYATLVEQEGMGFSVEENDAKALSDKICSLLSDGLSDEIRKKIRSEKQKLSWDRVIECLDLYCRSPNRKKTIKPIIFGMEENLQRRLDEDAIRLARFDGLEKMNHDYASAILQKDSEILCVRSDKDAEIVALHGEKASLIGEMSSLCLSKDAEIAVLREGLDGLHGEKLVLLGEMDALRSSKDTEIEALQKNIDGIRRAKDDKIRTLEINISDLNDEMRIFKAKTESEILGMQASLLEKDSLLQSALAELSQTNAELSSIYEKRLYKYLCAHIWSKNNKKGNDKNSGDVSSEE